MQSVKKMEKNCLTWLTNYRSNTLKQYRRAWDYWLQFIKPYSEEWVFENKATQDWSSQLIEFHRWLKRQPKGRGGGTLSDNSASVFTNAIRGYLKHVGIGLDLNKVQKMEISKVESMPLKDYPFDLKTKERILAVSDPIDEYIVSVGISLGLRISDFLLLTRGQLEPLLDKEVPIPLGKIMTVKEGIPAYPYLDGDAVCAIKRLLEQMNREGKTFPQHQMLTFKEKVLNGRLTKLFEKANIPLGSYRIRFHVLRKFISDSLASVCSGDKWKWFVGKSANSSYIQGEGFEAYKSVLRLTQVIESGKAKTTTQEIKVLKQAVADQNKRIDKLENLLRNQTT